MGRWEKFKEGFKEGAAESRAGHAESDAAREDALRPPAVGEQGVLFVGEEGLAGGSYAVLYADRIERRKKHRVAPAEVVYLRNADSIKVSLRKFATSEVVIRVGGKDESYLFNKIGEAERFHELIRGLLNQ